MGLNDQLERFRNSRASAVPVLSIWLSFRSLPFSRFETLELPEFALEIYNPQLLVLLEWFETYRFRVKSWPRRPVSFGSFVPSSLLQLCHEYYPVRGTRD